MEKMKGKCDSGGFFCKKLQEQHQQCSSDTGMGTTTECSAAGVGWVAKCPQDRKRLTRPGQQVRIRERKQAHSGGV